jgi:rSAM/selenodomain-associated transferase 1
MRPNSVDAVATRVHGGSASVPLFSRRPWRQDERTLIVFARAPVVGMAKTRLITGLDEVAAHQLYTAMFLDTLALARRAGMPVLLSLAGESHVLDLPPSWEAVQQPDRSFGERLSWSFEQAFRRGAKHAVLIGADLPQLAAQTVVEAFAALATHDAVVGPTLDGGYYLLGLNQPSPWLFNGVSWSTAEVYGETLALLTERQKCTATLAVERDVDTLDDALVLAAVLREEPQRAVLTARVLREVLATG